jgi:hypothetical protein
LAPNQNHPKIQYEPNHIVHAPRGTTAPDVEQPRGIRNLRIFGLRIVATANELHSAVAVEAGVLLDTFSPMRDDFLA